MVTNSSTISSCSHTAEPFVTTSRSSTKIFQMPFGHTINMTAEAQLHTREPARTVDIAPGLNITCSSALAKLRGWITLPCSFTLDEVQIFDGKKATITSSVESIIGGWKNKQTIRWQVPILPRPGNEKATRPDTNTNKNNPEVTNNVHKLPSTKQIIRYYHAAAGFSTEAT